ncbi:MAG: RsmE family RNA methyltransferase [Planctomycetota bacterium]|nr:RsmE family RNA methyltransferase [Planctomycetota bacterium]
MARHLIFHPELDDSLAVGARLTLGGEEAHHAARVKRLDLGAAVGVCDGRGRRAACVVRAIDKDPRAGWTLTLEVTRAERVPPEIPRLEVWAAAPKGARLEDMIEGLSEVGAASVRPLVTERTVVEPRAGKLDRLGRLAAESLKQCGRAWLLEIQPPATLAEALVPPAPDARVVVADASGQLYQASGGTHHRLLIGPEGGWTPRELSTLREEGARIASFGPHVMRVETAAVVAASIMMHEERRAMREALNRKA